jgi:hypothetical protein
MCWVQKKDFFRLVYVYRSGNILLKTCNVLTNDLKLLHLIILSQE